MIGATAIALLGCELAARGVFPAAPDYSRRPPILYQPDPELRYVIQPNQRGWIAGQRVTINGDGFRGQEVLVPKPAGRVRVAIVGDSITLGWGVADDESMAAELERDLAGAHEVDVVDMGVPGYDTRQEVELLERNVARLEPDVVLVGFYVNDVPEAAADSGRPAVATSSRGGGDSGGQLLQMDAPTLSPWVRRLEWSRLLSTAARVLEPYLTSAPRPTPSAAMQRDILEGRDHSLLAHAWKRVDAQFDALDALARSRGFSVGVIVLPPRDQVAGRLPHARYQTVVRAMAERHGFFVIDPLPALQSSGIRASRLFIPYDGDHPSAEGHRLIAAAVARAVTPRLGR